MGYRVVITYVCPRCAEDINPHFALPPVSSLCTCRKCGFQFRRSIASTAQAWTRFGAVAAFLATPVVAVLWNLFLFQKPAEVIATLVIGAILGLLMMLPGAMLGFFLGFIVGLVNGSTFQSANAGPVDGLKAMAAAQANALAQPSPALSRSLMQCPRQEGPILVPKRCWHCGHAFEVRDSRWEKVQCPQCKANLGVSSPRGEATYDPDE
jgi:hypothetical protein